MILHQAAIFLVAVANAVTAERYTNYNVGGSNPNLDNPMYWSDAVNVLQDLKQFQALYIKFHSCVYVTLSTVLLAMLNIGAPH